jgi:hypothetical protein
LSLLVVVLALLVLAGVVGPVGLEQVLGFLLLLVLLTQLPLVVAVLQYQETRPECLVIMVATPYFQLLLLLVVAVEVRILALEPLEKMVGQAAVALGVLVGQMLVALVTHHQLLHLKATTVVWEVVALVVILLAVVVGEQVLLAAQQQVLQ